MDKGDYCRDSAREKILRASLKSNVEKHLTNQNVVILDSMNYIKGYRYELFCIARHVKSTLCLVYCDTDKDTAR